MLKMFCSRDMALFLVLTPAIRGSFRGRHLQQQLDTYYPDKQSRSHPRIARINEVAATVEKRMAAWLG